MWGFRKLCVLEVWPFLILNSCVWARILAQHWSWVVQPCLAPLVRWAKMPWGAERFEIHLHGAVTTFSLEMGPCVHTAKPPEMWPKHHPWSLESWTSKTGSVPWLRRRPQNPALECLLDSGFQWFCHPATALFCFGYFSGFSLDQKSCYWGAVLMHSCIWWGAFF